MTRQYIILMVSSPGSQLAPAPTPRGDATRMHTREYTASARQRGGDWHDAVRQQRRVTGKLSVAVYRMCLEQTMWPHGVSAKDQHGQFYIPSQKVFSLRPHVGPVCQPRSRPDAPKLALSPNGSNPRSVLQWFRAAD